MELIVLKIKFMHCYISFYNSAVEKWLKEHGVTDKLVDSNYIFSFNVFFQS